jgi:hypothetical protein
MLSMILTWHKTISWKLGYGHGTEGRPHCRPWWVNEALYTLAFTYATRIETPAVGETATLRRIDQSKGIKDAP